MKQTLVGLVLVSLALAAPALHAQEPRGMSGGNPGRFGAGIALGVPIGDWGDSVDFTIGLLLDLDYAISPNLSITGRLGYLYHDVDVDYISLSTVPLWGGIKYFFSPPSGARPFFAAELGLDYNRVHVDGFGSDSDLDAGLTLGGGFELDALSIRAFFVFLDLGHASDSMELMATVSYYFVSF